jgi:hypothetical protein
MRPRQVVEGWVEAFYRGDAEMARAAIQAMFAREFIGRKIAFQRGYWDKLSFLRLHGLEQGA